jgi:hypothetical protein
MADYFQRLKSPTNPRPTTPGPGTDKARTEILKTNLKAYNPTGASMVSNSVNKTALHPGGVEPSREHTELEVCIRLARPRTLLIPSTGGTP